jgi:hypothetical protein
VIKKLVQAIKRCERARLWHQKQNLAAPSRYYGNGGTIHHEGRVDIGVNSHGRVEAVWFRCQMLPFKQYDSDESGAGKGNPGCVLTGVEILDGGA